MLSPQLQALFTHANVVELSISTCYVPDGLPGMLKPGRIHLRLGNQRCSLLTEQGAHSLPLDLQTYTTLLDRVRVAMTAGSGQMGTDTAIGRDITTVQLSWWNPEDPGVHQIRWDLNHYGDRGHGPVVIQDLLAALEPLLPEDTATGQTWRLVRAFFRVQEPAPGFDDGFPVAYPSPGVAIPIDHGLWVRVGQHPGTRGLYRIACSGWHQMRILDAHDTVLASGYWYAPPEVEGAFAIRLARDNAMILEPLTGETLYIQRPSRRS